MNEATKTAINERSQLQRATSTSTSSLLPGRDILRGQNAWPELPYLMRVREAPLRISTELLAVALEPEPFDASMQCAWTPIPRNLPNFDSPHIIDSVSFLFHPCTFVLASFFTSLCDRLWRRQWMDFGVSVIFDLDGTFFSILGDSSH
ncbi:hypothetical protein HPP92_008057 [Vanilla planifolia]|uniref:Uncharacterized protein n=1 Tax=Vanilla planifolia TaxID=51239 RepID=A0A835RH62_VANPL|nr:hypothetical protein HPP92_008019 [Vanilla planifolia]KAG0491194.1 hypothetical protein HPP92_008057 [Vanilla planifolia]